jgi:hypothetical protein
VTAATPEFTEGDWRFVDGQLPRVVTGRAGRVTVCGVHKIGSQSGATRQETVRANGHVLAAAKDLYAAVEAQHQAIDWLLARCARLDHGFLPSKSPAWGAGRQGYAALQKARGLPGLPDAPESVR